MSQRRRSPAATSKKTQPAAPAPARPAPRPDRLGWLWGAAVLLAAALVRLIVASQLGATALFRAPQLDSLEYLVWARKVAAGTMIWPVPPPHGPGYPTFLGLVLRLFDGALDKARMVQALLGAGTCALAASLASRAVGRRAGLTAGLLLAVCGPLVFLDVSLLAEGLLVFLLVLALWLFVALEQPLARSIAPGLVLGLAVLVRPTALVVLPVLLLGLLWGRLRQPRAWAWAVLLAAAFFLPVVPVVWKISRVNGAFVPVQGYSGYASYIGNTPKGDGLPSPRLGRGWDLLVSEAARAGIRDPAAQDRYYRDKMVREIREAPGAYVRLLASKALWLVQAEEVRDSHSYYFFRDQSALLRLLPGFGLLVPLAACGIGLAVRGWRAWRDRPLPLLLLLIVSAFAFATVMTMVGTRYRIPLAPWLAVFGGAALIEAWDAVRARHLRTAGVLAAGFAAAWLIAHARPYPPSHNFAEEWVLSGKSLEDEGDFAGAKDAYDRALAADPKYVSAWEGIGRNRLKERDLPGAEQALRKALQIDPQSQRAHYYLAIVLRQTLRADEAEKELRTSLALVPDDVPTLSTLGEMLLSRGDVGDVAQAEPLYRRLVTENPNDAAAHLALARIAGAQNRPQDGIPEARRATELEPDNPEAWLTLARLALGVQDAATAEQALERTEALAGTANPQVALTRALLYRLQGKNEEAEALLRRLGMR